jgi:hypothetical protein
MGSWNGSAQSTIHAESLNRAVERKKDIEMNVSAHFHPFQDAGGGN